MKPINLEDIIKKPLKFALVSFPVGKMLADDIIKGYVEKEDYSKPLGTRAVPVGGFPPRIMMQTYYAQIKRDIPRTQALENIYTKFGKRYNRNIFIQTCRCIIDFYGGYENTPPWFTSAIQNIGIY
jgi:hypothetical protein